MAKDDEREFRLRPRKPPARNERAAWASAYKILMHHARMSGSRKRRSVGAGAGAKRTRTLQPTMRGPGHVREEAPSPDSGEPMGATSPVRAPLRTAIPRRLGSMVAESPSTSRSGSKAGRRPVTSASGS